MKIEECFFNEEDYLKFNINISYPNFIFEKIVLSNNIQKKIYEGESNNYYKIIKNKEEILIYYRASNNKYLIDNKINIDPKYDLEKLCIAKSKDGLNFNKVNIEKNNIIMYNNFCHNFFPNYINGKYLGLSGTNLNNNGLYLFNSENGINWKKGLKICDKDNILQYYKHKNHFDTHNISLPVLS